MRLAALYDIHGNLPALEAVLDDVRRAAVDLVVVGGDVLPGPMPHESLAVLQSLDIPLRCIRGNGDRVVLEARAGVDSPEVPASVRETVRWTAAQLTPDDARFVAGWPSTFRQFIAGIGEVCFCHATLRSDTENFTRRTPEARVATAMQGADAALVVCGHTHMPFDVTFGAQRVINAGSVGMPFGVPGASWLVLGPDIQLRRTAYDQDEATERIRATSYPQARHFAEHAVLRPPTEEAMLELLS
jgi:predicted phosphodiesterase